MILDNFYTSLLFLPHQGVDWLCHAKGTEVTPLAPAPGTVEALRRFSSDRTEFGFLDQQGKRLGHYRILEQAPWIEVHNSIATLPRRCLGHDFVVHDGQMIVGGQGPDREALWCRGPTDTKWQRIALPPGIGRNGKAIDALFVRGRELVAIDNLLLPKWILVYSLDSEWSDEPRKYPLATHTSYEHVLRAAEGDDCYAILSAGINHDIVSNYLAFICKTSLEEIGLWSGICSDLDRNTDLDGLRSKSRGHEPMHHRLYSESDWETGQILKAVKDIHVYDDSIFLALGALGIVHAKVVNRNPGDNSRNRNLGPVFNSVHLNLLKSVQSLKKYPVNRSGCYAVGIDSKGYRNFEWFDFTE